ncbi:DUF6176 family protein [Halorussus amylolyticus]|uniref:DUF6176 family protein n=1 Tax=Halorussus amylolyticus TaxID=1126242 RepID=UPI00104359A1|nr:DUF6176 family protein [Halorussus amylolyticus]
MADTFVRKQRIQSGKTERLRELLAEMTEEARADEDGVLEIWEGESLHTLSLFIERTDDADYLVWYIEADDIDQLIEFRQNSTHPLHDIEDEMMAAVLEGPESVTEYEPVFHGVNPNRPQEFVARQ